MFKTTKTFTDGRFEGNRYVLNKILTALNQYMVNMVYETSPRPPYMCVCIYIYVKYINIYIIYILKKYICKTNASS